MDLRVKGFEKTETAIGKKPAKYLQAEHRMRLGKRLVFSGFVISIVGVVAYCVGSFNAGLNFKVGGALYDNPGWLLAPTLGTIGLGTLLWLLGSFIHLKGAMDSDPEGPIL